jgi:hypothetical protein
VPVGSSPAVNLLRAAAIAASCSSIACCAAACNCITAGTLQDDLLLRRLGRILRNASWRSEWLMQSRRDESEGGMDMDKRPRHDEQRKGCCQQKRRQPFDATRLSGGRRS